MTYSIALPLTLPSLTSAHRQSLLEKQPLVSLYEVFATLPDPRSKHGLRYELAYLLICLVAGLLCNCDSTLAVAKARVAISVSCSRGSSGHVVFSVQAIRSIASSCLV